MNRTFSPLSAGLILLAMTTAQFAFAQEYQSPFQQNYRYGIFFARTVGPELNPDMSLKQLEDGDESSRMVKKAMTDGLKKSLFPLIKAYAGASLVPGVNIQNEIIQGATSFSQNLKAAIKEEVKKSDLDHRVRYQIVIGPAPTQELINRSSGMGIKVAPFYSLDKYSIFEVVPTHEEVEAGADEFFKTVVYKGLTLKAQKYKSNGIKDPFLGALTFDLLIEPKNKIDDSKMSVQAIVGLPTDQSIPLEGVGNDEIKFQGVVLPQATQPDSGNFTLSHYPMALVRFEVGFKENEEVMTYVELGPIAGYENGQWHRQPGTEFKDYVPKLRGHVAKKVWGISLDFVEVDFRIYNLYFDVTKAEVTHLDLHLGVGLSRLPGVKFGNFNKPDIDNQFQAEINSTIKAEIENQKKAILEKLMSQGVENAAQKVNLPKDVMNLMLEKMFTIGKTKN